MYEVNKIVNEMNKVVDKVSKACDVKKRTLGLVCGCWDQGFSVGLECVL